MNLSLTDAYGRFAAKPCNRSSSLSAIAADGAVVLTCASTHFGHPSPGVLRYEDRLSRERAQSKDNQLLGQHLALAREGALPIRMVVATAPNEKAATNEKRSGGRTFHVRSDLIGKLVTFDGDHFVVDFTRLEEVPEPATGRRK